ncbi:hypothetical protein [Phyllobacterium bourgognense]|uniref:Uncharacterized protein n=1 Tax=Phyllobacterium bourgognense TaxID=314236 RepID=A0A368Z755_9HYPH|nr:hypothetical protein [Phyllobacterium bourgognense]RCW87809.1 hypothetical protein C7476_101578 [Phyllobacterium bourgognense]
MLNRTITFLKRLKAPVTASPDTVVHNAKPAAKKPRRVNPDSDGKLRRLRELVEHNRLI